MDIKEKILIALGLNKDEEIKLGWQAKSEDGTIFVSTAEELESGVDVSVLTEDGTTIPLPIGTYKTDTGVSFRVEEEGVVGEVEFKFPESDAEKADWAKSYEEMKDKVDNLMDAIADIKARLGEGESEEVEMTEETVEETPSDNPKTVTTKTTEVVEFSAEDEIKKLKEENENLKTELAKAPAEAPINTNKFSSEKPALSKLEYSRLSKRERILMKINN